MPRHRVQVLRESNQAIPNWLEGIVRQMGAFNTQRSGNGTFGGQDIRQQKGYTAGTQRVQAFKAFNEEAYRGFEFESRPQPSEQGEGKGKGKGKGKGGGKGKGKGQDGGKGGKGSKGKASAGAQGVPAQLWNSGPFSQTLAKGGHKGGGDYSGPAQKRQRI